MRVAPDRLVSACPATCKTALETTTGVLETVTQVDITAPPRTRLLTRELTVERLSMAATRATALQGRELAPVDSNHHTQIQSLVSCRWTRGQRRQESTL